MSWRSKVLYVISQFPNKRVGRPTQMVYESVLLSIPVLVYESLDAVCDCAGVVLDPELFLPFAARALDEALVLAEFALDVC